MLPSYYRFTLKNETGETLASGDASVKRQAYKFASNGALQYGAYDHDDYLLDTNVLDNAFDFGDTKLNTTTLNFGGHFIFEVTTDGSPNGDALLYLEPSVDSGVTFPSSGDGMLVAALNFAAAETKRTVFEL